jgi:hypothetical protein
VGSPSALGNILNSVVNDKVGGWEYPVVVAVKSFPGMSSCPGYVKLSNDWKSICPDGVYKTELLGLADRTVASEGMEAPLYGPLETFGYSLNDRF